MSTYFDRELKKKLYSMGISSTSSDTLIKDYSAQRDYRSFDTYRKTDLLSQKEQDYIDDLKFKSYIKEEQKRRETLSKISSVTQTTSNMQKIEDLLNQSQIEKVKASKLFDFAKSYFDEIKEEPTYHNLYDNYIDEVARSRASVTKEKPDVAREYAQQERPFKRWLWERAIDEVARSDALEGVVDPMEFRRELIHKLPSGELKHIEQPKTEELSGFQQFAKSVAETVLPGAKPKPEQVPGVGTGQLELENKRVSGIEAVGKQFVGSLVGTMRSMFTAGTFTPEEQEQKKAEHRDAESLSGVEKWLANAMVKGAKNMAKSGSGRSLLKAAEAVDVAGQSARAEDYILSAGYNLEQVEQKLYSEADMENRAWYTKLFSQAINTLPTIGLVSATGGFGLTALAVSGVKTQSENITRRQQAGEDISAGAGIAYVMGNVAIDVLSHAAFSRLATPGVDSVGQSLTNAINGLSAKIFGSSARVVGTNAAQSALKMAGKELAKVIAEGGAINLTNYVLSGFLSKVTVDKERALMGLNKDELITITGMLSAFASGGLRGAMVGVGRYARQKQTLDALAKMSGRDAKDVTVGELWQLYLGTLKDAEGQGYTQDFAKASGRALQTVVDGQEVTDAGAKLVPVGKAAEPIKTEVVAAPQAATKLTQPAPAQVKSPQSLPQEQKQELIDNTIKDVGAAEETKPTKTVKPISTGATISSSITPTEYQDTKVAVLKTGDVIPSMDQNGIANPDYDMTYQPRDVNRRGSTEQINEIASNLNVKKMYEKETIQNGMPVVGANGMVIAGNHRVAALLKVKEQNPDKYEEYKQYARDHAQELGLSADDLQGDFIVTRMLPEGTDLQQVADQSNIAEQRAMSPPELAKRDAGLLTDNVIDLFVGREDGSLMTAENQSFREAFISEVLGGNTDGVMDDKGNWSVQGLERLSNAILYKAYGSTRIATLATETLDHNFKRIVTALRNVAPQVIKFRDMVAKGQAHDIDVAKLIIDSTEKWIDLKQSGQNLDMYVRNVEIDETPESIRAKEMLRLIDKNKGSHQRLTRLFNDIIGTAVDAGHPQQLSMFDDGPITIDEILEIANRRDENDTITETTGAEVPTQVSGERSSGDGAKVEQKGPAEIQTESKQKANKQVKVSEDRKAKASANRDSKLQLKKSIPIVDEGTPKYKMPDKGYNKYLMALAKKLLSPARYDRLDARVAGQFKATPEETSVHVSSITATRTLAHEIGHALDYQIQGRYFEGHDALELRDRFPGLEEKEIKSEAIKVSQAVRPTDTWDDYRDSNTELISDVYSLYLLDKKALHSISPKLYAAVTKAIKDSDIADDVSDTVGKVTYEKTPAYVESISPIDRAPDMTDYAKKTSDKALAVVARNARERSAYIADKKFITKRWNKDYTEQERQDAGALVEGIRNLVTGEEPVETDRLKELVTDYRYEIEKIREELNKIVADISDEDFIAFLDDYLPHFYEQNDTLRDFSKAFAKKMRASKERKLPTLEDAVKAGLKPLSQDVALLLDKYVQINATAAFNMQFVNDLFSLTTKDGLGIISEINPDGTWERVDHPAINKFYARVSGKDKKEVMIQQKAVYVHPEAWKGLRPFFGQVIRTKPFVAIAKLNAISKHVSHMLSFFHYGNVTESALQALGPANFLTTRLDGKRMWTYKAGQLLMDEPAVVRDALLAGLQFDPHEIEPYGYAVDAINKLVSKSKGVPVVGKAVNKMAKGHAKFQDMLWNGYVGPVKLYAYHYLMSKSLGQIEKHIAKTGDYDLSPAQLYQLKVDTADFVNNAIGGLEKESYKWTPAVWQIGGLLLRSPEYTMANINNMFKIPLQQAKKITAKATGKDYGKEFYPKQDAIKRRRWAGSMGYLAAGIMIVGNALNALSSGKPMWKNPPGRKMWIDITAYDKLLEKIIPGYDAGDQRRYIRLGKQMVEVVRLLEDPMEVFGSKMSPVSRAVFEQISGSSPGSGWDMDFKGKDFWKTVIPFADYKDLGIWESMIPSRLRHIAASFVPLSLKGNNFAFTFPMVRGVSKYKMARAYQDVIISQVDPSLFGKMMPKGIAAQKMKELEEAAVMNGYSHAEILKQAQTATRTQYYPKFWDAINSGNTAEAERIASILVYVDTNISGLKQSGKYREFSDETIRKAVSIVEKQKSNKRR